jgi:hypothetical protein
VRTFFYTFIALLFLGACSGGIRVPLGASAAVTFPALPVLPASPSKSTTPTISFNLSEAGQVEVHRDSLCKNVLAEAQAFAAGDNAIRLDSLSEGLRHLP